MILNRLDAWDTSRNILFVHFYLFLLVGHTSYFIFSSCLASCRANTLAWKEWFCGGIWFYREGYAICRTVILIGSSLRYFPYYFAQYFECILVLHLLNYVNKLFMSSNKYASKCKIWIKTKLIFISLESYIFSHMERNETWEPAKSHIA